MKWNLKHTIEFESKVPTFRLHSSSSFPFQVFQVSTMSRNSNNKIKNRTQTLNYTNPILINVLAILTVIPHSSSALKTLPPLPILPLPSSLQLQWQLSPMSLFFHFGPNTFTDSEWGTGHANPSVFNPTRLNASQWVNVAKEAGFSRVILTTKHHDGFCLWPSEYTDYSVKSSSWRNGNGDVVGELAMAAKEAGIALGLYLSPWDRHESCYGKTVDYNKFYLGQMVELLTRYGDIKEVFLDSARGETDMEYYFDTWFSLIHQLQPEAAIFSNFGPDTRWVGNEAGFAASTCWSLFNRSRAEIGGFNALYSQQGDPHGPDWMPAECDVSIRPGWFWHSSEVPKSALQLLDIYYLSAGQNCHLLLNVPPNASGLISDEDIQVLQEFKELRMSIFDTNLAKNARLNASSIRGGNDNTQFSPYNVLEEGIYTYWAPQENQSDWILYINLEESMSFNVLQVQEPIQMGQRIIEFHLESLHGGKWKKVINGTTVGYKRLLKFPTVESQYLKFVVDKSRADPLICYLGIHMDRFSVMSFVSNTTSQAYVNGGQGLQQVVYNYSQIVGMK